MLSGADDFPSPAPELAGDATVADHVALAFAVPEGAVGFRAGVALGAVVPTASSVRRRPELRHFTSIGSEFYPELSSHCEEVFQAWAEEPIEEEPSWD